MSGERWEQLLADRLQNQANDSLQEAHRSLSVDIRSRCESPIEAIFAASLARLVEYEFPDEGFAWRPWQMCQDTVVTFLETTGDLISRLPHGVFPSSENWTGIVTPQAMCGRFRVDFLFGAIVFPLHHERQIKLLAVECDGHDFHERTKEQAERDKARDRELQAGGVSVFRFTGSKIYRDPDACVEEVYAFFRGWADPICRASLREAAA